jgi:hypothetical protein
MQVMYKPRSVDYWQTSSRMKHVSIRQVGGSLYFRIPPEWVHANNLRNGDLAFLTPAKDRVDKFVVTLAKLPIPQEAVPEDVVASELEGPRCGKARP